MYLADIEASYCAPLLVNVFCGATPTGFDISLESRRTTRDSGYFDEFSTSAPHDLYLAAPSHHTREEALQYHIITRNFFAWLYEKPLVGDRFGQAIIRLQERMDSYRPNKVENQNDILKYLDDQGYTDFRHCPDHALGLLQYAENYQLQELWTDAFVHCAGMNDELDVNGELEVSLTD